jgi:hypothetical protein
MCIFSYFIFSFVATTKKAMTKEEILHKITSTPKYYAGIFEQSYASNTVKAIKAGTCKPETETKFFEALGYTIDAPAQYKMKPEKWFDEVKYYAKSIGYCTSGDFEDYADYYNDGYTPEDAIKSDLSHN